MNEFGKFLKVFGFIIGIFLVGGVIGWLGTRGAKPGASPPVPVPVAGSTVTLAATSAAAIPKPTFLANNYRPLSSVSLQPQTTGTVAAANLVTNWEDRLDEVLSGKQSEDEKAKEMLEMFPRLPPDGQEEVAQHLSNLVSDEYYPALGQFLTNSALPEPVLDVLLSDALNRPNKLKLPVLVEVARDPANPKAGEAKDLLELYLEEDYGADWNIWVQKVEQWLKDNPD
jgi:hypothetical protein